MSSALTIENSTLQSWLRRPEVMAVIPGCMRYVSNVRPSGGCGSCEEGAGDQYMSAKKCIVLLGDTKKRELMAALRVQAIQVVVPISGRVKTLVFNLPK